MLLLSLYHKETLHVDGNTLAIVYKIWRTRQEYTLYIFSYCSSFMATSANIIKLRKDFSFSAHSYPRS